MIAAMAMRLRDASTEAAASAETFETVYARHYRDVFRYVLLMVGTPDEAEDVVADAFGRAWAAWRSGHGPAGAPLPWLLTIARRLVIDRWRRRRLIGWLPLLWLHRGSGPEPAAAQPDAERAEFWLWVRALTAALPERQREVLFLRYQRDLADEEIGEILGLSASGVRSLVARALDALRRHPELLR